MRSRLTGEGGFTLVESLMAAVLLLTIGTTISGLLASSVSTYSSSRQRTLAEQLTQDQIEAIRRMPFSSVGVPNGNPSGTVQASRTISVVGLNATMTTQITYVDDQTPNAFRTYANYKKIVITVKRSADQKQLTREVTFLSAAAKNAATESSISVHVADAGPGNVTVPNATVNLGTGPSAPRIDSTDSSGTVVFPSLTANPAGGQQAYYDLTVTPPFGYVIFKDDLSPSLTAHKQLGVAEPWDTTHPRVQAVLGQRERRDRADHERHAGRRTRVSIGSARGSEAFSKPAGTTFTGPISSVAGEQLMPPPLVSTYTAGALGGLHLRLDHEVLVLDLRDERGAGRLHPRQPQPHLRAADVRLDRLARLDGGQAAHGAGEVVHRVARRWRAGGDLGWPDRRPASTSRV